MSGHVVAQSNLDFEQGTTGWKTSENVKPDKTNAYNGNYCLKIGPGYGYLYKRLPVLPLAIVQFDGHIKSSGKGNKGHSFIRFYNEHHQKLLEYKGAASDSVNYQQTGNYTEAPPFSTYMEIGVESDSLNHGYIYADDFSIIPDAAPKTKHAPMVDVDRYLRAFWQSDTVFNETVLLYSANGAEAAGKLLFMPDRILSVKSFDLKHTYKIRQDYTISGSTINRAPGSGMPFRSDTSFDQKKDLAWFNTQSQWVVITYTHHDKWTGPVASYKGDLLPNTLAKLKGKKPLKIVAFGMSITRGMNISSYDAVPPYMPTYVDLFARQLRKAYHSPDIRLYNAGLPGATVDWGAEYADQYVNPLKPDLVIIDFGMNDFWRLKPEQFRTYIETIIRKVRAANPAVEFLLISNMKFDPAYVLDSDRYKSFYTSNLEGYSDVLVKMETKGVINLNMYDISSTIYQRKKAKDCISNPLHPNDYLERWFAQSMCALLVPKHLK